MTVLKMIFASFLDDFELILHDFRMHSLLYESPAVTRLTVYRGLHICATHEPRVVLELQVTL